MSRPLLLDLFCGAGGAAMGYYRAGFDVVGVDVEPQPHYPFDCVRADALEVLPPLIADGHLWKWEFDAIHASPPCQAYSRAQRLRGNEHPDLLSFVRTELRKTGLTYVIENVPGSPMTSYVQVCGKGLGLGVKRHRWFESNYPLMGLPCGVHLPYLVVYGHAVELRLGTSERLRRKVAAARSAMGIDWMNREELREAIPPAYTEFVGSQLLG